MSDQTPKDDGRICEHTRGNDDYSTPTNFGNDCGNRDVIFERIVHKFRQLRTQRKQHFSTKRASLQRRGQMLAARRCTVCSGEIRIGTGLFVLVRLVLAQGMRCRCDKREHSTHPAPSEVVIKHIYPRSPHPSVQTNARTHTP